MDDLQVEMRSTGFKAAFKNVNEFEYNIIKVSKPLCNSPPPHRLYSYSPSHEKVKNKPLKITNKSNGNHFSNEIFDSCLLLSSSPISNSCFSAFQGHIHCNLPFFS